MLTPKPMSLLHLFLFMVNLQFCAAVFPLDPNSTIPDCSCYQAAGNDEAVFLNHQFFDFRNLANETFASNLQPPMLINGNQSKGIEPLTSPFFGKGLFGDYFLPASWTRNASAGAPITMVNSQQNVYLTRDTPSDPVHLTLRTNRLSRFQSISDLETSETGFLYASIRVLARITGSPGACAGIFTYHSDDQESDIEILTRDTDSTLRATNQPGLDSLGHPIPDASNPLRIPSPTDPTRNGSWTTWNEYQLNWLPSRSEWLINGISTLNKTYGVPSAASNIQIKIWSDGGDWTGKMMLGESALLDIRWVDLVFNTTHDGNGGGDGKGKGGCERVCSVVDVERDSVPRVVSAGVRVYGMGGVVGIGVGVFWTVWMFL